jgi:membrane protease YdiL (CAAX protease family)
MQPPDGSAQIAGPSRRAGVSIALTLALFVIVFTLVRSTASDQRTPAARRDAKATRLYLGALYQCKALYTIKEVSPLAVVPHAGRPRNLAARNRLALRDLEQVAEITRLPRPLRKLAIMQATLGDGSWEATLGRMRSCKPPVPEPAVAAEIAMWRTVFGKAPLSPAGRPGIERQIRRMDLAWFQTPALAALYRKTGQVDRADALVLRTALSIGLVFILMLGGFGLGLVGLVIVTLLLVSYITTRRLPDYLPAALQAQPIALPTRRQADLLYGAFALYIASFLGIRVLRDRVVEPLIQHGLAPSPVAGVLISVVATAVMFAIPFGVLALVGPRAGLRFSNIGFRIRGLWPEVVWGVIGYAIALPLVVIVTLLVTRIPGVEDSAMHPIVNEVGMSGGTLTTVLLFVLAAVVAPLTEETMFRGVFFNALAPRVGTAWSLVIASLVFSILHPQLPVGGPAIFVLGAVFSTLYVIRGSLIPSMIAHAINNAAALLMMTLIFTG